MTMTDDEIARLRGLLEKAIHLLKLPLHYDASLSLITLPPMWGSAPALAEIIKDNLLPGVDPASCDVLGDLFVAAVNALPALLAERAALKGQVEVMREIIKRAGVAVSAAYAQADAEHHYLDVAASKYDNIVQAWRSEARSALAAADAKGM